MLVLDDGTEIEIQRANQIPIVAGDNITFTEDGDVVKIAADLSGYAENDGSYPDMTVGNATTSYKCAMVRYATSSSSATATALTATIADGMGFSSALLTAGLRVAIEFKNAHTTTSSCTLNVNSTGAKTLYNSTGTSRRVQWSAGTVVEVVYDGTAWKLANPVMYIIGSTLYLS